MPVPTDYSVVSQIHVSKWSPALQQVIPGWEFQIRDTVTGTIVPVFIADSDYDVTTAQQSFEAALVPVRQIAQLGARPTTPSA